MSLRIGSLADLIHDRWGALLVSNFAGVVSTLLMHYLPRLMSRYNLNDAVGVLSIHAVPGMISSLSSIGFRFGYIDGKGLNQLMSMGSSIGISFSAGLLVGYLTDRFCSGDPLDDDSKFVK